MNIPEEIGRATSPNKRNIKLGLCAMAKKVKSKPMKEILHRLARFTHIVVVIFEEKVILDSPVAAWPIVDALLCFFSHGFPLDKAISYADLRKPYLINDLKAQYVLMDRRKVYETLKKENIPVPRYEVYTRNETESISNQLTVNDDSIEINGTVFNKPFVEKPVNADDHNIYIYFPSTAGGGSQRLFRKIGNRSSKYVRDDNSVRQEGSFIYEDFMPTDGTDVKVYTVSEDYAHAEARKSPALDGKVERDSEGKEIRFPVILSTWEKLIAKKVVLAFKQQICGFDLLRANGVSYVCDVNGFSFVKSSRKYYDDCGHILGTLLTRLLCPHHKLAPQISSISGRMYDEEALIVNTKGTTMELRCVIAVIRHGDRTPKQKMKMEVHHPKMIALFKKYGGVTPTNLNGKKEIKMKKPKQLQELLDIVRELLAQPDESDEEIKSKRLKFEQLRYVLELYGHFSGINRKVQMKYQATRETDLSSSMVDMYDNLMEEDKTLELVENNFLKNQSNHESSDEASNSGNSGKNSGKNSIKGKNTHVNVALPVGRDTGCVLLIVKWGGELTAAGRQQAERLGKSFRRIYPGGSGKYDDHGSGLLRLHSTYRHDLKIYASDEGRVQMTAAAFAKGFLALEGELPPILVQMVKSANTNGLLDSDNDCRQYQNRVKARIHDIMSCDREFTAEDIENLIPTRSHCLLNAVNSIKNPVATCYRLYEHIEKLFRRIVSMPLCERSNLYHSETWELIRRRWGKLLKDFKSTNGKYDLSKIPDIYDNIKYDYQHNLRILNPQDAEEFFLCAQAIADFIVPQEYGLTEIEKLVIGQRICSPLMRKILADARYTEQTDQCTRLNATQIPKGMVSSPDRFVRTRLYFTSESHLHSLLTCLRYGGLKNPNEDERWKRALDYINKVPELNYLSQIVILIYEDPNKTKDQEEHFSVEIMFSPGAHPLCRSSSSRQSVTSVQDMSLESSASSDCTTHYARRSNSNKSENNTKHICQRQCSQQSHRIQRRRKYSWPPRSVGHNSVENESIHNIPFSPITTGSVCSSLYEADDDDDEYQDVEDEDLLQLVEEDCNLDDEAYLNYDFSDDYYSDSSNNSTHPDCCPLTSSFDRQPPMRPMSPVPLPSTSSLGPSDVGIPIGFPQQEIELAHNSPNSHAPEPCSDPSLIGSHDDIPSVTGSTPVNQPVGDSFDATVPRGLLSSSNSVQYRGKFATKFHVTTSYASTSKSAFEQTVSTPLPTLSVASSMRGRLNEHDERNASKGSPKYNWTSSHDEPNSEEPNDSNVAANYMTYPTRCSNPDASLFAIRKDQIKALRNMMSPNMGGLISTAVIRGSAPDLPTSVEKESAALSSNQKIARHITSAPSVEDVYPLETLHNSLTLSQLEDFLIRLTTHKYSTPWPSPRLPGTPVQIYSDQDRIESEMSQ